MAFSTTLPRICTHPHCTQHQVGRGYCATHQPEPSFRAEYYQLYSTKLWKQMRLEQLSRHPLCVKCLHLKKVSPANTVDHKVPHRGNEKLFYQMSNLASLCHACHSEKTSGYDKRNKSLQFYEGINC